MVWRYVVSYKSLLFSDRSGFRRSLNGQSKKSWSFAKSLLCKWSLARWTGMCSCEVQFKYRPCAVWMNNIQPDVNRIKGLHICNFNSVLLYCHYGDGEHTCSFVCLWVLQAFVIDCHGTFTHMPGVICWFSSSFCSHAFKSAKADSLMAEIPGVKQRVHAHTNKMSDKVICAINVNSRHFFPKASLLPVWPLS